jgi:hypothetical protein
MSLPTGVASSSESAPVRAEPLLPIVYIRGYAGATSGIDTQVDDPFYGFNHGATHVRVGGDGDPLFYQFEGPMLRLMIDEGYQLLVRGDQLQFLDDAEVSSVPAASLWVYRFYDQAATTFVPQPHHGLFSRVVTKLHQQVTSDGFDIETAAEGLYDLIMLIRLKTGAPKVHIVAHSMGGLVARCMMQKVCFAADDRQGRVERDRLPPKDIVARFFTYGTPHGGISFEVGALDWAERAYGPAGSGIFSPAKMYGYLTPGAEFGKTEPTANWDPQELKEEVFDPKEVFCLIGTDPKDYGLSRVVVGPKSDGLVRIEHAYVRKAHRAYVHKSHSGSYGEVNSEEGYQNLRRFLFGRWHVQVNFTGLPHYPNDEAEAARWSVWQADLRLAIRGLSVVMSEQQAAHWCPIQLNDELKRAVDTPDHPVPLLSTFLLDPAVEVQKARDRGANTKPLAHDGRARHVLGLRVYQLDERGGVFRFGDHLEQVPDWADSLIVDIGPDPEGHGADAWAAWNHDVGAPNATVDPIGARLKLTNRDGVLTASIPLPDSARSLPILGATAALAFELNDRGRPKVET